MIGCDSILHPDAQLKKEVTAQEVLSKVLNCDGHPSIRNYVLSKTSEVMALLQIGREGVRLAELITFLEEGRPVATFSVEQCFDFLCEKDKGACRLYGEMLRSKVVEIETRIDWSVAKSEQWSRLYNQTLLDATLKAGAAKSRVDRSLPTAEAIRDARERREEEDKQRKREVYAETEVHVIADETATEAILGSLRFGVSRLLHKVSVNPATLHNQVKQLVESLPRVNYTRLIIIAISPMDPDIMQVGGKDNLIIMINQLSNLLNRDGIILVVPGVPSSKTTHLELTALDRFLTHLEGQRVLQTRVLNRKLGDSNGTPAAVFYMYREDGKKLKPIQNYALGEFYLGTYQETRHLYYSRNATPFKIGKDIVSFSTPRVTRENTPPMLHFSPSPPRTNRSMTPENSQETTKRRPDQSEQVNEKWTPGPSSCREGKPAKRGRRFAPY